MGFMAMWILQQGAAALLELQGMRRCMGQPRCARLMGAVERGWQQEGQCKPLWQGGQGKSLWQEGWPYQVEQSATRCTAKVEELPQALREELTEVAGRLEAAKHEMLPTATRITQLQAAVKRLTQEQQETAAAAQATTRKWRY